MCPVCVANMTLIAVGATSSGGLTAFAMGKFYKKKQTKENRENQNETRTNGIENKSEPNESSGSRVGSCVARRAEGLAHPGKGIHSSAGCAQRSAAQAPVGQDR